ncbi:MAG TPA: rhomboid family intramembrane serine protease [Chitinophagaceae bacterium]|jgi:membrane associated rhomboid family serine protease|nr:rhomboid family intramembrane serine protease [Chitinophagaceae bacterium]
MSNFRYTRPDTFPPVIKNLVIINALVFLAQLLLDSKYNLTNKLALYPVDSPEFKPYQVFTHMFTHSTIFPFHIIFNMLALWMFGRILENVWGAKRFLTFYLVCGIGAAGLHLLIAHLQYDPDIMQKINAAFVSGQEQQAEKLIIKMHGFSASVVGASGAVMGIMVAFGFLFPNTSLYIWFIPIPIKAKWAILGFLALDLFGGVYPTAGNQIAHWAHLGGALTGFIIVFIWNKTNRKTLY